MKLTIAESMALWDMAGYPVYQVHGRVWQSLHRKGLTTTAGRDAELTVLGRKVAAETWEAFQIKAGLK